MNQQTQTQEDNNEYTVQDAIDMVNHYYSNNPNVVAKGTGFRGIIIEVERNLSNYQRAHLSSNVTAALHSMGFSHLSSKTYENRTKHKYARMADDPSSIALRRWEKSQ